MQPREEPIYKHLSLYVTTAIELFLCYRYMYLNCITSTLYSDDFSRVKLKEIEGVEGSDYINASFLDVIT